MKPGWVRRGAGTHLSLLPTAALTVAFFLIPLGLMIAYSFGTQALFQADVDIGPTLEQYERVLSGENVETLFRSLAMAVSTAVACLLIGFPIAYIISRKAGRYAGMLLVLILIPFWTSFLIRTYAWTNILGSSGPVNDILMGLGIVNSPVQLLNSPLAVGIGMVYTYLPFAVLPLYAVLRSLDDQTLEAAADLGASRRKGFMYVTLPLASTGIVTALVLVMIPAMGEFIVPQILGGGKTLLLGNLIATQFGSSFNWPLGCALAIAGLLLISVAALITSRLRRTDGAVDGPSGNQVSTTGELGFGSVLALAVFLAFLYLPILIVALNAFNADSTLTEWGGLTTVWVEQAFRDPDVLRALRGSLLLAVTSTALSLVVGTTGALWLSRVGKGLRRVVMPFVMVRLVLPEIVLIISLLLWLSLIAFPRGLVAAAIGQTVFNSTLVTLVVLSRLDTRGMAAEEAAADLYANGWQRFRTVTLPGIAPAVAASGLLVFTLSFDDVVTPFFLAGGDFLTLPVLVLSKVRFEIGPEVNAIALMMMLVTAIPVLAALLLRRYLVPGR